MDTPSGQQQRSQTIKADLLAELEALEQSEAQQPTVYYALTRQWPKMVVTLLAVCGLFIAGYLALYNTHVAGGPIICTVTGSCEDVNNSPYGFWFGIPVSVFGVIGYIAIMLAALVGLRQTGRGLLWATNLQLAFAVVGFLSSAWFTSVEAFILKEWCQWCVGSAIIMTLILILSIVDRLSVQRVEYSDEQVGEGEN